jgi:nucleoside-diphosphate-sugar epimerase
MVHIDDCVEGMIKFMSVPRQTLTRSVYNIQSLSFSPHQLQEAIKKYSGHPLTVEYVPDYRQAIADSWPDALDDSFARRDWGWSPKYDLPATIKALLK